MPVHPLARTALAAGLLAGTAGLSVRPAAAQLATAPVHQASAVKGGQFAIEPGHTIVTFGISHMSFSTYYGRLSKVSGSLSLDAKAPSASTVSVSVPVSSISTTSSKLDSELVGPQWLDAATYPTATFVSSAVQPTGPNDADIAGTLTLHGVTKPVTLHAHFVGAGVNPLDQHYTVGFDLTGSIRRSDFGIKTYLPLIGDDVTLTIAAAFEQK